MDPVVVVNFAADPISGETREGLLVFFQHVGERLRVAVGFHQWDLVLDNLLGAGVLRIVDARGNHSVREVFNLKSAPLAGGFALGAVHVLGLVDGAELLLDVTLGLAGNHSGERFHLLGNRVSRMRSILNEFLGLFTLTLFDTEAEALRRGVEVVADRGPVEGGNVGIGANADGLANVGLADGDVPGFVGAGCGHTATGPDGHGAVKVHFGGGINDRRIKGGGTLNGSFGRRREFFTGRHF